jgi:hypothetical protein
VPSHGKITMHGNEETFKENSKYLGLDHASPFSM